MEQNRRGTARLRAQLAAHDQNGNGVEDGYDKVAVVAAHIKTTPEDDSLAIRFSLLRNDEALETIEYSRWLYIVLWPLMTLYALWAAPQVWLFRLLYWRLFYRPPFNRRDLKIADSDSVEVRREKEEKLATLAEYEKRWLLGPEWLLWFFDSHWLGKIVRNGVLTSQALDGINAVPVLSQRGQLNSILGRLVRFWLNQPDGQAVRNRLRITYKAVLAELCELWEACQPRKIRVLSLACGSAQATIEALAVFLAAYADARDRVELHLVDLSGSSLMRAIHLARERGVADRVFIHEENILAFVAKQTIAHWDIVEMVGFLDYRPWKSAVAICREIRRILLVNGMFVSAHIAPSAWSFVVRWVINWPMLIRRTIEAYRRILLQSGFAEREIEMRVEPHRIHPVGVCRKLGDF